MISWTIESISKTLSLDNRINRQNIVQCKKTIWKTSFHSAHIIVIWAFFSKRLPTELSGIHIQNQGGKNCFRLFPSAKLFRLLLLLSLDLEPGKEKLRGHSKKGGERGGSNAPNCFRTLNLNSFPLLLSHVQSASEVALKSVWFTT